MNVPAEMTMPAFCEHGHRIVMSTGDHAYVVRLGDGSYQCVIGTCDELLTRQLIETDDEDEG